MHWMNYPKVMVKFQKKNFLNVLLGCLQNVDTLHITLKQISVVL